VASLKVLIAGESWMTPATRLRRHGISEAQIRAMLVANPERVFSVPATGSEVS
jgi:hypothetical protein